ncbi:CoA ligase [Paramyrothecium foliicola]|nr:CoA ligase [Paramyrothecium foliicola]
MLPKDLPIWSWLFDSKLSPLVRNAADQINGFTDAVTKEHIGFDELKTHTTHVSTALVKKHGLAEGDVAIVFSRNSVWYPVAYLSVVRVGAIACGVSPDYSVDELTYSLKLSKAKFIFTTEEGLDRAYAAAANAGISQDNVILVERSAKSNKTSLADLLEAGRAYGEAGQTPPFQLSAGRTNIETCAYLGFSSGTTGLPKGVMISHANVIAQCLQMEFLQSPGQKKGLAALPFYHITGIIHQLHLPIYLNNNTYILTKFTLEGLLKTVGDYKINDVLLVPPIIIHLVRNPGLVKKFNLQHIDRFSSGAAPLSEEVTKLLEKQFPGTGFKQGYGMTESSACITAHPPDKHDYKYAHKVGTVVASTVVKIVDPETGKELGVGEAGEIWAKGPQVTMGYLDNPKATAETYDKDGFLHTGDIGSFDEEGFLSITDRLKELIKVKGVGVAPAELEDLLLGHPAVKDVAVCGIADERAGERPKAFVVLADSHLSDPVKAGQTLIEFSKANKARPKWLGEVEIVQEIPKSPSGKILRRKFRNRPKGSEGVVVRDNERAKFLAQDILGTVQVAPMFASSGHHIRKREGSADEEDQNYQWSDLLQLSIRVREHWDPKPVEGDEVSHYRLEDWKTLNSFISQLVDSGYVHLTYLALWEIYDALESPPTEVQTLMNCRVGVVTLLILRCAQILMKEMRSPEGQSEKPKTASEALGPLFGKNLPPRSLQRWSFWKTRLTELLNESAALEVEAKTKKRI